MICDSFSFFFFLFSFFFFLFSFFFFLFSFFFVSCSPSYYVVHNAVVHTMEGTTAASFAVNNGIFVDVGSDAAVFKRNPYAVTFQFFSFGISLSLTLAFPTLLACSS